MKKSIPLYGIVLFSIGLFIVGHLAAETQIEKVRTEFQKIRATAFACAKTKSRPEGIKCFVDASPKKCEAAVYQYFAHEASDESVRAWFLCVQSCVGEGWWSSTFGECSRRIK